MMVPLDPPGRRPEGDSSMPGRDIIVVGASAGGVEALGQLARLSSVALVSGVSGFNADEENWRTGLGLETRHFARAISRAPIEVTMLDF